VVSLSRIGGIGDALVAVLSTSVHAKVQWRIGAENFRQGIESWGVCGWWMARQMHWGPAAKWNDQNASSISTSFFFFFSLSSALVPSDRHCFRMQRGYSI
jgi:hypothetical protein